MGQMTGPSEPCLNFSQIVLDVFTEDSSIGSDSFNPQIGEQCQASSGEVLDKVTRSQERIKQMNVTTKQMRAYLQMRQKQLAALKMGATDDSDLL
jgi:hypothetical protein